MPTLTTSGRNYDIVEEDAAYGACVAAKQRCAILTTYQDFGAPHEAALRAVSQAGGDLVRDYNHETHLRVTCESCQRSLTPHGIGMLIMMQLGNVKEVVSLGRGKVSLDACPNCGHPQCYVIFDPEGFEQPRSEIAYYLCYQDLEDARRYFELVRTRLDERGAGLDFHGVVELRTDVKAVDLPFPHWIVIDIKDAPPSGALDSFLQALDLAGSQLDYDDHDTRRGPEHIEENRQRTKLHDSAVF